MITVAVVEDNQDYIDQEVRFLNKFSKEESIPLHIDCYQSGLEFLERHSQGSDIILLDIEMPGMSGMDTAKALRKVDEDACIIFVTQMPQYAIMGYEVGARYYILKPVQYYDFSTKLKATIEYLSARNRDFLFLKSDDGIHRVNISDIRYLEGDGHLIYFHTNQGVLSKRASMKDMVRSISDKRFAFCGNSFLVNMEYITAIDKNTVTVDGRELPMSRARKKEFVHAVTLYLGGKML